LRIAVNSECNLRCFFCHAEGEFTPLRCSVKKVDHKLSKEQIVKVVEIAASFGVKDVKITGGEPLLRNDIVDIVRGIASLDGIREVSMVTNGLLLEKFAEDLYNAGLKRVNVSLHSLKPEIYSKITGYRKDDGPDRVLNSIKKGLEVGLFPVKINVVVLKGLNDNEIWDFIDLSAKLRTPVQFIEYHEPPGLNSSVFKNFYYPLKPLELELEKISYDVKIRRMHHRKRFYLKNGAEVEIVRPMFNPDFCANCTRLRVTADGEFKPCLMRDDNHVRFIHVFEGDNVEEELKKLFLEANNRREPFYKFKDILEVSMVE